MTASPDRQLTKMTANKKCGATHFTVSQLAGLVIGVILIMAVGLSDIWPHLPKARPTLAATLMVVSFWLFEVLPLPVTSLLPIVLLPLMGVSSTAAVASSYWSWILMLVVGAFIVAVAIEHTGLHKRLALLALSRVTRRAKRMRPLLLISVFAVLSFVISMFCSNTATVLMLVPFARSMIASSCLIDQDAISSSTTRDVSVEWQHSAASSSAPTETTDSGGMAPTHRELKAASVGSAMVQQLERGLLLGICYASNIGGMATLIGNPVNAVLAGQALLSANDVQQISFSNWFLFAFPLALVLLVATVLIVHLLFTRKVVATIDEVNLDVELQALGRFSRDECAVLVVQAVLVLLFLIRPYVLTPFAPVNDATVSCFCAVVLFLVPSSQRPGEALLPWKVAEQKLPWGVLLLVGGGFAIGSVITKSGLTEIIGGAVSEVCSQHLAPISLLYLVVLVSTVLTELASNVAVSSILMAALSGVAAATLTNPVLLLAPVCVGSQLAFMLPQATPPNSVVFATERVPLSSFMRAGVLLNLTALLLSPLFIFGLGSAVYGLDGPYPEWACAPFPEQCVFVPVPGNINGFEVEAQSCRLARGAAGNLTGCMLRNLTLIPCSSSLLAC